jgi:hypothetical protein
MTHETAPRVSALTDRDALVELYRRVGGVHASLAEAAHLDEALHIWALDQLMDVLDYIEATGALDRPRTPTTA